MKKQFLDKLYQVRAEAMASFNEAVRELGNEQPTTSFETWLTVKKERQTFFMAIDDLIESYLETP